EEEGEEEECDGEKENSEQIGENHELDELAANLLLVDEQLRRLSCEQRTTQDSDRQVHTVLEEEKYEYTPLTHEQIISLELFMICHGRAAGDLYEDLRAWVEEQFKTSTLSLDRIKRCIKEKSHIMPEAFDMCPNSCIAYTGEWSELTECPKCHLSHYREPTQQYFVVPFEAPLQARWATEEGASASKHRARRTKDRLEKCPQDGMLPDILDDIYCGSDYLKLAREKKILPSDTVLALSLDGAQVFNNKKPSDAIFVIMIDYNLPPEIRYKQQYVIPIAIIPGPNKPWDQNSFLHPIFQRVTPAKVYNLKDVSPTAPVKV
ncbi:hypothetical protein BT69DRAFT_1364290, partial [Atractiella rhizophila]